MWRLWLIFCEIALNKIIRENTDAGKPTALGSQESSINNILNAVTLINCF